MLFLICSQARYILVTLRLIVSYFKLSYAQIISKITYTQNQARDSVLLLYISVTFHASVSADKFLTILARTTFRHTLVMRGT